MEPITKAQLQILVIPVYYNSEELRFSNLDLVLNQLSKCGVKYLLKHTKTIHFQRLNKQKILITAKC